MSIALAVKLKPSRILQGLAISMCLLANLAVVLAFSAFAMPYWLKLAAAAVSLILSAVALMLFWRDQKSQQLHISNGGQINLHLPDALQTAGHDFLVKLDAQSTLWPHLLSLYLRAEDGRLHKLLILPDSLDDESFRALSAALHWISRRKQES